MAPPLVGDGRDLDLDRYILGGLGSGWDPKGSSPDRDWIGIATFRMAWIGWDPDRGILDRARSRGAAQEMVARAVARAEVELEARSLALVA